MVYKYIFILIYNYIYYIFKNIINDKYIIIYYIIL